MKKLLSFTLALLLCLFAVAGCGKAALTTPDEGTTKTPPTTSSSPSTTTETPPASSVPTSTETPGEPLDPVALSYQAAAEGIVLLKNEDNALPLKKDTTVAMFGSGQVDLIKGGTGSSDVTVEHVVGILEGMRVKEAEGKVSLNATLADRYEKSSSYMPSTAVMKNAADTSDTAIYVISRRSGEGYDRTATAGDYYLSANEITFLDNLVKSGFENIVVILNVGGIVDTTKLLSYPEIKSILLVWQPGMEGGHAIADVLVGDTSPSGKLTDTFAADFNDYPTSATYHESDDYVKYTEDVYVGYRYFETFDPNYDTVNYEFGFGLSYTTFSLSDVTVTSDGENLSVKLKVTNTGSYSGKEVVQVYFSAPQGKLGKPAKELCAFGKTETLSPGESQDMTLTFAIADMASYDDVGHVQKSAYVLEKGDYQIFVGNSIRNAGQNGVRYTYTVEKDTVTEQLSEQLTAKLLEKRLKADGTYENIFNDDGIGLPLGKELTKIEAEAYYAKHCHAEVIFNSSATICGIETLTSDAGNRYVTFAVEVETAGKYKIALGIGNGGARIENGVTFYVNEQLQSGQVLPLPRTGGIFVVQEVGTATLTLSEGLNFIKVYFACGDSFRGMIDYITLEYGEGGYTEEEPETQTVKADGVTTVQGETYTEASADVGTEDISAGADVGGISVKNLHTAGYSITYTLNAEEAGTYRIVMRLANGLSAAENSCRATVNGKAQTSFGYALATTSVDGNQWFNFVDVPAGTITLDKGANTITFTVVERMGNLDYFTLEKVSTASASAVNSAATADKITFSQLCEDRTLMDAFLDQLTVEQLVYLLHGHGENIPAGTGSIGGIADFGIPSAETADGSVGIRLDIYTTAFPIQTMMACTWNTELLYQVGSAVAAEATEHGVSIWLAPGTNIHRNPLCGRNFEYASEDPFLSGMVAGALIGGAQDHGVGVAVKHFVANEKETNRGYSDSRMSERALREIYLKPFEIAVKTVQPWMIMSSYNKLNGVETAESYALLTEILRSEWGFTGVVTTDWWNDSVEYKELLAGNNLKMKSGDEDGVLGAYKAGILTREDLEENVRLILELIMKTNAMERATSYIEISGEEPTVLRSTESTWKSSEIGMEACEDITGGFNTTNTYEGQWMTFLIDVEKAGKYTLTIRVASTDGTGGITFNVDDKPVANFRNTLKTGGWQTWGDAPNVITLTLPEGQHELKLAFTQGGFNINTLTLTPQ